MQASGSPWKDVLARLWTRLRLGPLPAGGRDGRWNVTVDGRTVTFRPSPDERGLVVAVEAARFDDASDTREIAAILRRDLGFLHAESGGLRLQPAERGSVLVVEDLIPLDASDAEFDLVVGRLVERAALHAGGIRRTAPSTQPGARRAEPAREEMNDIIFRP